MQDSRKLAITVEKIIFVSRWLQSPIYLLLMLVLLAFTYEIAKEIAHLFAHLNTFNEEKLVVLALTLCDAALVANLVVIVIISGYENFVSRIDIDKARGQPLWIKRLSPDAVKMKIAGSIIAISSISLLKQFLEVSQVTDRELLWGAVIHGVFVTSALLVALIGYIEKLAYKKKQEQT